MANKDLKDYIAMDNIAEDLDEQQLNKIGKDALEGFEDDLNSSKEWMSDVKKVLELASLKTVKKAYPLPNSANIKFPIITKAALEFASRVYPEIVKDGRVVKPRIVGKDYTGTKQKQGQRVADYMNYQLLFESCEWEQDLDKLLNMLALVGFICKKTYFDPIRKKNKSDICDYEDLIINCKVKNLYEAPRINHILHYSINDLIEHARSGVFLEKPVQELIDRYKSYAVKPMVDLIEQHCYLDLDEDDYAEPYIVTVIKDSGKVVRIKARYKAKSIYKSKKTNKVSYIEPVHYFTDFHFLPSPKGHFQGVGFGILMLHLNETINTMLNMITDAGQLANLKGGYIDSRAKIINDGNSNHDMGEFKIIKTTQGMMLKDAVHPIQFGEPSSVLYQVLGLLISASKELSSSTEVMTGSSSPENVKSGAMLALIEQGMKVFTAIQKRVYRGQTEEFKKLFDLNSEYLDPEVYVEVLDDELAVSKDDFDSSKINVIPVADPNLSTEITRSAQAQFLLSLLQSGAPGLDPIKVIKRVLESTSIPNVEELMVPPDQLEQQKNAPNPEVIKLQAEIEHKAQQLNIEGRRLENEEKQIQIEALKIQSEIILNRANALKAVAQADQANASSQLGLYDKQLQAIQMQLDHVLNLGDLELQHKAHQNEMDMRQQEVDNDAQQNQAMGGTPPDESSD